MSSATSPVLVGLDVGTSAVRASAFDNQGHLLARGEQRLTTNYADARMEQDARTWSTGAILALGEMASHLGPAAARVVAIGLTGQCPSFTLLDDAGEPLTPGILYGDNRATEQARRLAATLGSDKVRARTGQWPGPFYIAPKLMWLSGRGQAARPTLAQPRDVVGLGLTGRLATDDTHAACTLLYDLPERAWRHSWAAALGLEWVGLPPVLRPWEALGPLTRQAAEATGLQTGLPVIVGGADSLCAALGCGVIEPGLLSDASGSSTCLDAPLRAPINAPGLSIYPHVLPGLWCADVGMNATGTVLRWAAGVLCDGDLAELERLAAAGPPGSDGLLFSPYLLDGERTDDAATGAWSGLSLRHGRPHLARAVYEGVTFGLLAAQSPLRAAGITSIQLRTSGGGGRSRLWSQMKADLFGLLVAVSAQPDAAGLGAALLAGVASGLYPTVAEAVRFHAHNADTFEPRPSLSALYQAVYQRWRDQYVDELSSLR